VLLVTNRKGKQNKQHNYQQKRKAEQTTQWPKENDRWTSNTMTKRKGQKDLVIVLLVLLSFSFGHCVACPVLFFWSLCRLFFCPFSFGHCVACPYVLNTMTKRKGTEGQATKLPTEKESRTNNTITNRKGKQNKQHNGQKKMRDGQASLFCFPFLLVIVLFVLLSFSVGNFVACPSVPFLLVIVLLVLLSLFF
jgi:hypothetical protein